MTDSSPSLEHFATRRFALAGAAITSHFPYCVPVDDLGVTRSGDGPVYSFAHYDYLNLRSDPRISDAAKAAVDAFGMGAGASRLVGGELSIHRQFEAELARFIGVDDALSLVSGYSTNVALVGHLMTKDDLILVDAAAHNSIMVGTQLARAKSIPFRHNDLADLGTLLAQHRSSYSRVLVVIEGLYSMDGDIPDLPRILSLCRRHGAWLMVDEAHSIGVLGKSGRGLSEHFGIAAPEIDLIVGTLSKAFGTCGGFIAGKRRVIEWLRFTLPSFVYSVGLQPPGIAAAMAALRILREEPERIDAMRANSSHLLGKARELGFDCGTAVGTAVIPVMFRSIEDALRAAAALLEAGFYVPPIVQIAVPKDAPRIRFFVTAGHHPHQIDAAMNVLLPYAARSEIASESPVRQFAGRAG